MIVMGGAKYFLSSFFVENNKIHAASWDRSHAANIVTNEAISNETFILFFYYFQADPPIQHDSYTRFEYMIGRFFFTSSLATFSRFCY